MTGVDLLADAERLRSTHPALAGEFRYRVVADGSLELEWALGDARAVLTVESLQARAAL